MILTIDCGNTNIVFGLHDGTGDGGGFRLCYREQTRPGLTAADHQRRFDLEAEAAGLDPVGLAREIEGAALASVVPAATGPLREFATRLCGTPPVVVGESGVSLGLDVAVPKPEEVGADRLVNAVAAHALYPGPLIVLDFGTATTFDVVDQNGTYCGGVIAPGINLALDALYGAAALLPRIQVARPPAVLGKDTVSAMQSGIYWGYVGLIEGIVARIRADQAGEPACTVIATGGLAPLFSDATDTIDGVDPDLTLRGLLKIYRSNRP